MDVNSLHCERIRNAVKQRERILRTSLHQSPVGRDVVIETDLNRVAQPAQRLVHRFDPLGKEAVQAFPGFIDGTGGQQMRKSLQLLLEFPLFSCVEDLPGLHRDIKDIDNLPRVTRRNASRKRIDMSGLYIQTERRQQSAKDREFRQVVETNDDDLKLRGAGTACRYADLDAVFGIQAGGHADMRSNFFG